MRQMGNAFAVLVIWAGMASIVTAFIWSAIYAELPTSVHSQFPTALAGAMFAAGSLLVVAAHWFREMYLSETALGDLDRPRQIDPFTR